MHHGQPRRPTRGVTSANALASKAFTLVELLVAIFIIIILIGILIPVIAKVRNSAYATSTQSRISVIVQAIQQYQSQFGGALPGPIPETVLNSQPAVNSVPLVLATGALTAPPTVTGTPVYVTSSQNLVLGLLGGLYYSLPTAASNPNTFFYDATLLGSGPVSLSTTTTLQYKASLQLDSNMLNGGLVSYLAANPLGSSAPEQIIPEFVDAFPAPLPILYMRAIPGITNTTNGSFPVGSSIETESVAPLAQRNAQYNLLELAPYGIGSTYNFNTNTFPTSTFDVFPGSYNYFNNSAIPATSATVEGTVHQKDSYILISAGIDRLYGTSDDMNNFDFVGQ